MTRSEFLRHVGLTDSDFNGLLDQFRSFYGSLNAAQQAVVNRAVPHFKQAAAIIGGDITKDQLKSFLAPPPGAVATSSGAPAPGGTVFAATQNGLNQITNGDGNGS